MLIRQPLSCCPSSSWCSHCWSPSKTRHARCRNTYFLRHEVCCAISKAQAVPQVCTIARQTNISKECKLTVCSKAANCEAFGLQRISGGRIRKTATVTNKSSARCFEKSGFDVLPFQPYFPKSTPLNASCSNPSFMMIELHRYMLIKLYEGRPQKDRFL